MHFSQLGPQYVISARPRIVAILVVLIAVLGLTGEGRAEAVCDHVQAVSVGKHSKSIARSHARQKLITISARDFGAEGDTCQPMSFKCDLKDNGWRCEARRTCCFADGVEKVCEQVTLEILSSTRKSGISAMVRKVQREKRKLRNVLGVDKPKCRPEPVVCRERSTAPHYRCSQAMICCNR